MPDNQDDPVPHAILDTLKYKTRSKEREITENQYNTVQNVLYADGWRNIHDSDFENMISWLSEVVAKEVTMPPSTERFHQIVQPDLRPPILVLQIRTAIGGFGWRFEKYTKKWIYDVAHGWHSFNLFQSNKFKNAVLEDRTFYLEKVASALMHENNEALHRELEADYMLGGKEAIRESIAKLYALKLAEALEELQNA